MYTLLVGFLAASSALVLRPARPVCFPARGVLRRAEGGGDTPDAAGGAGVLAAANRAMIKPSEFTPATSALMAEMIAEAYDPAEVAIFDGSSSRSCWR